MTELHVHAVRLEDPRQEEPAATRERLRGLFPAGATRRMTQLGLLIGSVLDSIRLGEEDALVYASTYAESRALEDYLAGFPSPSPTLFQTSIQPSAVQQVLIVRQQALRQFLPLTGRDRLAAQALQAALLAGTPRVIVCGGEERGSRLRELGITSAQTFAFAIELTADPVGAVGTLNLGPGEGGDDGDLTLPAFFDFLRARRPLRRRVEPGIFLSLAWH